MSNTLADYGLLLEKFLSGAISVEEFQATYLDRFKNEEQLHGPMFELLDELFGDVDSFTTDQQLLNENPGFYLDEVGLRERVRRVANRLSTLKSSSTKSR
jgi:Bacterial self-protective colicin-like immunity